MKKVTVLAFAFAAFGFISTEATAQTQPQNNPSTQQPQTEQVQEQQDANKQQITEEELPEGVKQALQNEALKDWQVSEVYKVAPDAAAGADAKATYEVYFTNAEQKQAVARFYETGKPVAAAPAEAAGDVK
ncbi:hypothetical protein [Pontibacter anaerobius]|uniref:PepSY domain-containing protein n=1 Tax=Pontibacter anaerobius TaxID=2993940 RepID=A0ABT3RH50_9BACT|nr:hypothetical protein [Pontibacter anaerobius]MCX2740707.1 hypothetical protein [Pontibacter anaerobius]